MGEERKRRNPPPLQEEEEIRLLLLELLIYGLVSPSTATFFPSFLPHYCFHFHSRACCAHGSAEKSGQKPRRLYKGKKEGGKRSSIPPHSMQASPPSFFPKTSPVRFPIRTPHLPKRSAWVGAALSLLCSRLAPPPLPHVRPPSQHSPKHTLACFDKILEIVQIAPGREAEERRTTICVYVLAGRKGKENLPMLSPPSPLFFPLLPL